MDGIIPKKKDLLNFVSHSEDLQMVAKYDVAMYIHLSLAMYYADEINEICNKYNLVMGSLKYEYKQLDKALRRYDKAFRQVIDAGNEIPFLDGYDKTQTRLLDYTEDKTELFSKLYNDIHKLVDDYVRKNVENDEENLEQRINEITARK